MRFAVRSAGVVAEECCDDRRSGVSDRAGGKVNFDQHCCPNTYPLTVAEHNTAIVHE